LKRSRKRKSHNNLLIVGLASLFVNGCQLPALTASA